MLVWVWFDDSPIQIKDWRLAYPKRRYHLVSTWQTRHPLENELSPIENTSGHPTRILGGRSSAENQLTHKLNFSWRKELSVMLSLDRRQPGDTSGRNNRISRSIYRISRHSGGSWVRGRIMPFKAQRGGLGSFGANLALWPRKGTGEKELGNTVEFRLLIG